MAANDIGANNISSFFILKSVLSDNVICNASNCQIKKVKDDHIAFCFSCDRTFHLACVQSVERDFKKLTPPWICAACIENPKNDHAKKFANTDEAKKRVEERRSKYIISTTLVRSLSKQEPVEGLGNIQNSEEYLRQLRKAQDSARESKERAEKMEKLLLQSKKQMEEMHKKLELKEREEEKIKQEENGMREVIENLSRKVEELERHRNDDSSILSSEQESVHLDDNLGRKGRVKIKSHKKSQQDQFLGRKDGRGVESWLSEQYDNIAAAIRAKNAGGSSRDFRHPNFLQNAGDMAPLREDRVDFDELLQSEAYMQLDPIKKIKVMGWKAQYEATELAKLKVIRDSLPPFEIFSGDTNEWLNFYQTYKTYRDQGKYEEILLKNLVKGALKGKAQSLVADLWQTSSMEQIIRLLESSFGNPIQIIEARSNKIVKLSINPQLYKRDAVAIMEVIMQYFNACSTLEFEILNSEYLASQILNKLNDNWRVKFNGFARKRNETAFAKADLQTLLDFIIKMKDDLLEKPSESHHKFKPKAEGSHIYATSVMEKSKSDDNAKPYKRVDYFELNSEKDLPHIGYDLSKLDTYAKRCLLCNGSHYTIQCENFKKAPSRQKVDLINEKNICRLCIISDKHRANECDLKKSCGFVTDKKYRCYGKHHISLHSALTKPAKGPNSSRQFTNRTAARRKRSINNSQNAQDLLNNLKLNEVSSQAGTSGASKSEGNVDVSKVTLSEGSRTVKVFKNYFIGNGKKIAGYSIGDSAAEATLLKEELREALDLQGTSCELDLVYPNGSIERTQALKVSLTVKGCHNHAKRLVLNNCYAIKNLHTSRRTLDMKQLKEKYDYLRNVDFDGYYNALPSLLIGSPHASAIEAINGIIEGGEGNPIALEAKLGVTVYGGFLDNDEVSLPFRVQNVTIASGDQYRVYEDGQRDVSNQELYDLISHVSSIDSLGIRPVAEPSYTDDEKAAIKILDEEMRVLENGHVEVPLIWNKQNGELPQLPDNYSMAYSRQLSQELKLMKKPEHLKAYNDNFQALIEKGYIREANEKDLNGNWPNVWYLPMGFVINENKIPIKSRNVYDASGSFRNVSLNKMLLKGPDTLVKLLKSLFRFRICRVSLTADVKEMYHRMFVCLRDQQCQRILWRENVSEPMKIYILQVLAFGPKSSPFTSQYVKNKHAQNHASECPEAVDALINYTYMDDLLTSEPTDGKALEVASNCIKILAEIRWELIGFQSNSNEVLKKLPEQNVKQTLLPIVANEAEESTTKVLGTFYCPTSDEFLYKFDKNVLMQLVKDYDYHPSKRDQVGTIARIFDALGLISHFTIRGKMLVQKSWESGKNWDDKIDAADLKEWKNWLKSFDDISRIRIPRCYGPIDDLRQVANLQLHIFSDAGKDASAACAYFCFEYEGGTYTRLVMAKAKVTPLSKKSERKLTEMPRLELTGCLLAARMSNTITEMHPYLEMKRFLWSDSEIVLRWILRKNLKLTKFAAPVIEEILELTKREEWRYVDSEQNVADLATKVQKFDFADSDSRWYMGAEFLKLSEDKWPPIPEKILNENVSYAVHHTSVMEIIESAIILPKCDDTFIDRLKPSILASWSKLVRAVGRNLRTWSELNSYVKARKAAEPRALNEYLSASEIERAEDFIFRKIQRESFDREYAALMKGEETRNVNFDKLSVRMDNQGIMRINSRVKLNKNIYPQQNAPVLPKRHKLVDLYLLYLHAKNKHVGVEAVIAESRNRVWILQVRQALRSVIGRCNECSIRKVNPVPVKMAPLPVERVDPTFHPFEVTGVDLFGPIVINCYGKPKKIYVMIFVCARSRFLFTHIVESLESVKVWEAIVTFWAAHGPCRKFISDNGTNFVGCAREMKRDLELTKDRFIAISKCDRQKLAQEYKLEWEFIPAHSPWFGGFYERFVKEVKRSIFDTLHQRKITKTALQIALKEAEHRINCRPLTHNSISADDEEVLTPHHLVKGRSGWPLLPGLAKENKEMSDRSIYRNGRAVADEMMRKFTAYYLPVLAKRGKWFSDAQKVIKTGDLVMLIQPNETRQQWQRARVIKIYAGRDGRGRVADVQLADGTVKKSRSMLRLAKLELSKFD